ncbi:MAG: glutamate-5-semialdehyde dehydrogenase [Chlorobi bacterium]|nr:glutamate-5-semialdehyde dehydrogenase [Chlorobiota bacterium]
MLEELIEKGKKARGAAAFLRTVSSAEKNKVLTGAAGRLEINLDRLLEANHLDIVAAEKNDIKGAFLDRLKLNTGRVKSMADGLRELAALPDPVGEVVSMVKRPNGLMIGKQRVPIGVIGIIYESRPNVTADAFGLCLKTGNATVLRGGKEAIHSNLAILDVLQEALVDRGFPGDAVQVVENTSRESARDMMRMNGYLDLLIPRGGQGLIKTVVENSSVPVIETGVGNCHVFVDNQADQEKAIAIAVNAKTHRPGVCNAAETLLIHTGIAAPFIPAVCKAMAEKGVEIRGDETVCRYWPEAVPATKDDWAKEYLDLILAVRVVGSLDEAVQHISRYGTGHSEAIVTENYSKAQAFLAKVDAAAVYVNASTRFTDGYEFGFGAEIGISTQKLHARGPLGLKELTSTKYIIYGNGQIRE